MEVKKEARFDSSQNEQNAITHNENKYTRSLSPKEILLSKVDTLDIYRTFYEKEKNQPFKIGKNISSPFSRDKNPSFKVYENGTYKCHSTGKQGDIFQFIGDIYSLDPKDYFKEILDIISKEFNLNLKLTINDLNHNIDKLKISHKTFTEQHYKFWQKIKVDKKYLEIYDVRAVESFKYFSSEEKIYKPYIFPSNIIAFSYQVNSNYEIYIPKQKGHNKFYNNHTTKIDVFGLKQLPKHVKYLYITAGKKDALVLNANGFYAVSFRSETHKPTKIQMEELKGRCDELFIIYDNDNQGQKQAKEISDKFQICNITVPKPYNDIADYFTDFNKDGFKKHLLNLKKNTLDDKDHAEMATIFHVAENYIAQRYDVRYNVISLAIELKEKGDNKWERFNENSMWIKMQKKNIKIPMNSLIAIMKSDFVKPYNPIKNYFNSLPKWDEKTDYIEQYASYLDFFTKDDEIQFKYHFKKWLARTVKAALYDSYYNKQALIISDNGQKKQNIGKTYYLRYLCPQTLTDYFAEDITNDKDSRILLVKNFLINLDELQALSKKDINHLKAYFSKIQINERLPYERTNSIIYRIASFIGSTNMSTFLQDETGSVRWLVFGVKNIDWSYSKTFEISNLWAQAYSLAHNPEFDESMTKEDIAENEKRNKKYTVQSTEMELINKYFRIPQNEKEEYFMNATCVYEFINSHTTITRISNIGVGRALTAMEFKRVKQNGIYGYLIGFNDKWKNEIDIFITNC